MERAVFPKSRDDGLELGGMTRLSHNITRFFTPRRRTFFPSFLFSCWTPWTGTTALLFPGECTEGDGKERIGMPLFSPVPPSAVCICQGTSVRRKGLERPGSSFVLHVYAERGTKMKFQAKVGVLQQEDLASWFVRVSAGL